jgi:hypothetical protein
VSFTPAADEFERGVTDLANGNVMAPKFRRVSLIFNALSVLYITLLGPCLSMSLDLPASQHVIGSDSSENSLKWKECGEVNDHTLECTSGSTISDRG